jgi:hypothetical protein
LIGEDQGGGEQDAFPPHPHPLPPGERDNGIIFNVILGIDVSTFDIYLNFGI